TKGAVKLGNVEYYFIIKTDLMGNIIWFRKYNWIDYPYPHSLVVNNQNEIYVAAELIINVGFSHLALSKLDSSGNIILSKYYNPVAWSTPLKIIIDRNGNLILTGRSGLVDPNAWDIFLAKIDTSGTFHWLKT